MRDFIRAPYSPIKGTSNVFVNNIKQIQGQYRLWKYVFDYEVEQPKLEPIPVKIKSKSGLSLFRYMKVSNLLSDIKAKELAFVSPSLWGDPFEQLFFKKDGIIINNITYFVRCICFTYDWIESEEAAWNRSNDSEEVVRVEYDFQKLWNSLRQTTDYKFYFSVMDYSMPRMDIIQLSNKFKNKSWCPTKIDEYLNVLSLKRKAFSYENEVRLFMVSTNPFQADVVKIKIPIKIESVCFPPKKDSNLSLLEKEMKASGIKPLHSRLYDVKK